jgi:predicted enzyme related to lactoylglutathione lyase
VANPIVHFEIPADNPKKVVDFYAKLFGWKIDPMGGTNDYWTVTTTPTGEGSINGGILKRSVPTQAALNYVKVDSLDGHCEQVEKRGGRIVHQKQPIPGVGWFAIGADPEGNLFGLFEEDAAAALPPPTA